MHAPSSACMALYRLHPQLRLCWMGRAPDREDELNPGSFGVVQLYHTRDCGDISDPHTFREYWNVTTKRKELGGVERTRVDRGPIFNRWGGVTRDWDPLNRHPIFVMTIDESYQHPDGSPMSTYDVYSHKFIPTLEHYLTPVKKRIREHAQERGRDLDRHADNIGYDMADKLWWMANRTGEASQSNLAYKHYKHQVAKNDYFVQTGSLKDMYWKE